MVGSVVRILLARKNRKRKKNAGARGKKGGGKDLSVRPEKEGKNRSPKSPAMLGEREGKAKSLRRGERGRYQEVLNKWRKEDTRSAAPGL